MSANFGVLFDWDGVIVDSSGAHERSWELLAAAEGRVLPEGHFARGFGMKNERIIPEILGWSTDPEEVARLGDEKERLYRQVLRDRGITALPGVGTFLDRLDADGVPYGVGSSTSRENIDTVLSLLGWTERFRHIVSARDVSRGKPDPEVFLKGAALLGVPAERCVVFEDAFVGLVAARAARMRCIGVATTHSTEKLRLLSDGVVHTLDEMTVADLASLVGVAAGGAAT
jgi:beta-phosphoglucomutase family hydrolase